MTANDCFELGRQSYNNKDYYHTVLWMREAMDRLRNDLNQTMSTSRADILEYLAFSVYKQGEDFRYCCKTPCVFFYISFLILIGNVMSALEMTNELLAIHPNHERAMGNKFYYEKQLEKDKKEFEYRKLRGDNGSPSLDSDYVRIFGVYV